MILNKIQTYRNSYGKVSKKLKQLNKRIRHETPVADTVLASSYFYFYFFIVFLNGKIYYYLLMMYKKNHNKTDEVVTNPYSIVGLKHFYRLNI